MPDVFLVVGVLHGSDTNFLSLLLRRSIQNRIDECTPTEVTCIHRSTNDCELFQNPSAHTQILLISRIGLRGETGSSSLLIPKNLGEHGSQKLVAVLTQVIVIGVQGMTVLRPMTSTIRAQIG